MLCCLLMLYYSKSFYLLLGRSMSPVQQVCCEAQQPGGHPFSHREGFWHFIITSWKIHLTNWIRIFKTNKCGYKFHCVACRRFAQACMGVRVLVTSTSQGTWWMLKWTGAKSGLLPFLQVKRILWFLVVYYTQSNEPRIGWAFSLKHSNHLQWCIE